MCCIWEKWNIAKNYFFFRTYLHIITRENKPQQQKKGTFFIRTITIDQSIMLLIFFSQCFFFTNIYICMVYIDIYFIFIFLQAFFYLSISGMMNWQTWVNNLLYPALWYDEYPIPPSEAIRPLGASEVVLARWTMGRSGL